MNNEMTVYEMAGDIQISRPPEVVLEEAMRAAKALGTVLAGKKKKIIMNGEQYLEFEDWQTVGRFYGVTAKIKETAFIEYGGVQGFEAKAVAIRADGMEISAAEAMCLNDEEKWSARTKYKYVYVLKDGTKQEEDPPKDLILWVENPDKPGKKMPQKERISSGMVSVPLYQLRSMAQTRAAAKALRNVLAWVVVLAGYKATPAEELGGMAHEEMNGDGKTLLQQPEKKTAPTDTGEVITPVLSVERKEGLSKPKTGEKEGNPYVIFGVKGEGDVIYKTFSDTFMDLATQAKETGEAVKITFRSNQYGNTITALEIVGGREPGEDDEVPY